jgi:O-acetyl-ADP-ribose deacetylase (regulator of RNase III)
VLFINSFKGDDWMIILKEGNLFGYKHQAYAQGVSSHGKMDRGIAVRFKQKYPDMYSQYVTKCKTDLLKPGDIFFYHSDSKPHVFNLITQKSLRKAEEPFLEEAVQKMFIEAKKRDITDIAMPEIGCGLGGLDPKTLNRILCNYFAKGNIDISVYHLIRQPTAAFR